MHKDTKKGKNILIKSGKLFFIFRLFISIQENIQDTIEQKRVENFTLSPFRFRSHHSHVFKIDFQYFQYNVIHIKGFHLFLFFCFSIVVQRTIDEEEITSKTTITFLIRCHHTRPRLHLRSIRVGEIVGKGFF